VRKLRPLGSVRGALSNGRPYRDQLPPMKAGCAGKFTHDYKRHGTTTLFAALNTLDGTVISMCEPRHRNEEWLKFLRLIDRKTPKHLGLHLIVDNYGTHSHPQVQAWLAKHPRFVMHFTPTSASWLNMVSVRRTHLERDEGRQDDGVHQGRKWTPCNKPSARHADGTTLI